MISALVETVGALGILASVAAKIAEWRKEYRRCKQACSEKKKPSEEGSMNRLQTVPSVQPAASSISPR